MSDRMVGHNGPMTDHGAGQRAATERPSGIATVVVAVLAIGSVAAAAIRAMPNMGSPDRGVFVSTAERMVAGDRLYVDVWDNKDPVFYYLMAAGRLVSPLMDYVLEVGWLAVVAVATYALARRASGATLPAVLAAATGWRRRTHSTCSGARPITRSASRRCRAPTCRLRWSGIESPIDSMAERVRQLIGRPSVASVPAVTTT